MELVFHKCLFFLTLFFLQFSISTTAFFNEFLDCIATTTSSANIVFTPNDTLYSTVLQSSIHNLRAIDTPTSTKPLAIITPFLYSHVQSAVICCVRFGLNVRIRSGGHDYEGLSYTSRNHTPFILLDLNQLRSVEVDLDSKTAWVESGATLGELYYWVSQKSDLLGFPAGECTSVGVGGQLSGGGFGMLARKYGLSVDNVVDARLVDVNGRIRDRDSMGEDWFWAVRGGGGGSFGVVVSWKINLVYVPRTVTVFSLSKPLDENGTQLVHKWQHVAPNVTNDLFINLIISPIQEVGGSSWMMQVTINSLFLGTTNQLLEIVSDVFPELGLQAKDCIQMSWIESVVYYSFYLRGQSIDVLKNRPAMPKSYFKVKSDYVTKPIPIDALEEIWKWCLRANLSLLIEPHGGKMSEIDETATPYPHREGNLYMIQYIMGWDDEDGGFKASKRYVGWVRRVYEKMTPYVSKKPRGAYVNFRDLDLGTINCNASYGEAKRWGKKYFGGNFRRLAIVKGMVDPANFFSSEQSVPPLVLSSSY